jgi:hypothetical protein
MPDTSWVVEDISFFEDDLEGVLIEVLVLVPKIEPMISHVYLRLWLYIPCVRVVRGVPKNGMFKLRALEAPSLRPSDL